MRFCIVGAGFSGAVHRPRALAEAGHQSVVVDERAHVAGNCHTARDAETGVMTASSTARTSSTPPTSGLGLHQPFGSMRPYRHRVQAPSGGAVYSLPVNLLTINQFFGTTMGPGRGARLRRRRRPRDIAEPANFEEQALAMVGPRALRRLLPRLYPQAMGHRSHRAARLASSSGCRCASTTTTATSPPYQAHPGRRLHADRRRASWTARASRCGWAPLRGADGRRSRMSSTPARSTAISTIGYGRLGYRTLDFEEIRAEGDYQGAAVMNYCDEDVPFTRITEHKHFAPWESHSSRARSATANTAGPAAPDDIPYYPIRLVSDEEPCCQKYVGAGAADAGRDLRRPARHLSLPRHGRDDQGSARRRRRELERLREGGRRPAFFVDPLG